HYQRLIAAEETTAQQHAWGTGEATIVGVRLEGSDGEERRQFVSGGPLTVRLTIELSAGVLPPRVAVEFRDANGGLLGASESTAEELGWETGRAREVCFEVPRLAEADGNRARPSVHALHRCRGEAARGGTREPGGCFAADCRDLLRPRAARLQPGAHRSEGRRSFACNALVRPPRVDDERARELGTGLTPSRSTRATFARGRGWRWERGFSGARCCFAPY